MQKDTLVVLLSSKLVTMGEVSTDLRYDSCCGLRHLEVECLQINFDGATDGCKVKFPKLSTPIYNLPFFTI
jgi:hypothetical protein